VARRVATHSGFLASPHHTHTHHVHSRTNGTGGAGFIAVFYAFRGLHALVDISLHLLVLLRFNHHSYHLFHCLLICSFLQCLEACVNIDWPHTLYILCLCLFCSVTPLHPAIHFARIPLVYRCISRPYSVVCLTKSSSDCNVAHKVEQEWDRERSRACAEYGGGSPKILLDTPSCERKVMYGKRQHINKK